MVFFSEFIGTALLILVGLSFVILDFGQGSPIVRWIPDPAVRRALTGFLFGATGGTIAWSWVGRTSGAHINPAVTLAFWLRGVMAPRIMLCYLAAQFTGAVAGSLPLLAWGGLGRSVTLGATLVGTGFTPLEATLGEVVTTFFLIAGLFVFTGHPKLRRYTPLLMPALYAAMVWLEAPLSGTSTNPARSFGPAVASGDFSGFWVYLVGPTVGVLAAVLLFSLPRLAVFRQEVAKLYHFEIDLHGIFRKSPTEESSGRT